ncbi:MAG: tRNA (adenosine(37)-N6)-threonylcarbamoyltransferase complex ATPase subunit type 1 TsaE [Candidatus Margulisiibacteriota bacterium]
MLTITNAGSALETRRFAEEFAKSLKAGDVIALYGQLGSGKTTFIQGLSKGLGLSNFVTSPSFVIINEYPLCRGKQISSFYHVDLYRLDNEEDIRDLGIEELFGREAIVAIEWADKAPHLLPAGCKKIRFEFVSESERKITVE